MIASLKKFKGLPREELKRLLPEKMKEYEDNFTILILQKPGSKMYSYCLRIENTLEDETTELKWRLGKLAILEGEDIDFKYRHETVGVKDLNNHGKMCTTYKDLENMRESFKTFKKKRKLPNGFHYGA